MSVVNQMTNGPINFSNLPVSITSSSSSSSNTSSLSSSLVSFFKNMPLVLINYSLSFFSDSELAFMSLTNRSLHLLVKKEQNQSTLRELGLSQGSEEQEVISQMKRIKELANILSLNTLLAKIWM